MFEDLTHNIKITEIIGNTKVFCKDAPLSGKRATDKKTGTALEWLIEKVFSEDVYPRNIFEDEKITALLEQVPPHALVEVELYKGEGKVLDNYLSPCIFWSDEEDKGLMIYIPNTSIENLENEIYKTDL